MCINCMYSLTSTCDTKTTVCIHMWLDLWKPDICNVIAHVLKSNFSLTWKPHSSTIQTHLSNDKATDSQVYFYWHHLRMLPCKFKSGSLWGVRCHWGTLKRLYIWCHTAVNNYLGLTGTCGSFCTYWSHNGCFLFQCT